MLSLALLAMLQQPAPPPVPTAPKPASSPIAKAVLQPAEAAVLVGDSIQLKAVAYDSNGREYPDVGVTWFATGGHFEGSVDSTGKVIGGATGTITVTALLRPKSGGRATTAQGRVTVLPQPAAKLTVAPQPTRLYVGQSLVLTATPYAANDDRRYDDVTWAVGPTHRARREQVRSGNRARSRAGHAHRLGRPGQLGRSEVTVVPNPVTQVALEPSDGPGQDRGRCRLQVHRAGGRASGRRRTARVVAQPGQR